MSASSCAFALVSASALSSTSSAGDPFGSFIADAFRTGPAEKHRRALDAATPSDSRPGANDLATDLNHDSRLAIFRQTDNGIAVHMAIFAVLLGVEHQVKHSMRDAAWKSPASIGPDDAVFQDFD